MYNNKNDSEFILFLKIFRISFRYLLNEIILDMKFSTRIRANKDIEQRITNLETNFVHHVSACYAMDS